LRCSPRNGLDIETARRSLAARISSVLPSIPGVGHLVFLEAPETFDAAMLSFLAEL
jgi:pimeloyl-ACP methyl ester carboxylesterase